MKPVRITRQRFEVGVLDIEIKTAVVDRFEDLGADGCMPVPGGPGLGVTYDWDFIAAHRTSLEVFE